MATLYEMAREVARACKAKADAADEAFLKHEDPRAIQGGAICDEACDWRRLSAQAYELAHEIRDTEG